MCLPKFPVASGDGILNNGNKNNKILHGWSVKQVFIKIVHQKGRVPVA